jgi:hypothetical protein
MAQTGFWYVVQASDASAVEVAKYLHRLRVEFEPTIGPMLDKWRITPAHTHDDDESEFISSADYLRMFWKTRVPEELFYACADPRLDDATWDLATARLSRPTKAVLAAIPSIAPVAVLFSGLGVRRAEMIPGWMGMFSLTRVEVEEAAEQMRKAHGLPPQQRVNALQHMHHLLDRAGVLNFPIANLLEAMPVVLGSALEDSTGLIAVSAVI